MKQTTAPVNFPNTSIVTISETDPSAEPLPRAAVALGREQDQMLSLKLPRTQMVEAVKNSRAIPLVYQEVLLAEIALIPETHDLIRLDFVRHAHGVGGNFTGTVNKI